MRITEVSLKNVKSYQEATISFPLGTIAISGPNGAGKSTILEAIGFALFDCLPYRNQREFMRHNATEADVRVSFLSRLDECEYQAVRTLRRTTGSAESVTSTYFVHSFDSNSRVAQQKQDVLDFLRNHIGLEDYDDLARVFDNVLGVPQGRLTADFLLTPGQRKDTFDPLLRVDAYRHVYDKLRDVLDVMQGNISEQERRVSALEPEAARLPEQEVALAQYVQQHVESTAKAQSLAAAQARLQGELKGLEAQRRTLEQQRDIVRQLTQQQQNLQKRLVEEQAQVETAKRAADRMQSAAAGYAAYRKARETLAALEEERKAAESLRQGKHNAERKLVALQTRQAALEKGVKEAREAQMRRAALAPQVVQQERLEALVVEFSRSLESARQYGRQVTQALQRVAASDFGEQLSHADKPLPTEASEDAAFVQARLSEQHEHLQGVGLWLEQRADLRKRYRQSIQMRDETAADVARCRALLETASRLDDLTQQLQLVQEKIGAYQAQRRFNEQSQRMAKDGLCPFFQDQCPKVDEGHSLIPVIATLVRDFTDHTAQATVERNKLESEVALASDAQKQVNRLADLEPRLRQLEDELLGLAQQEQDLTQRIAASLREVWPPQAIAATIASLEAREKTLARELEDLGNPRQIAERLFGAAGEYEQRTQTLASVSREHQQVEEELARIDERLKPYFDLEHRVAEERRSMNAHRDEHDTYLRFQQTAADLPRREEARAALVGDIEKNARAVSDARRLLEECEASWDPAALAGVQADLSKTQGELGAANERIRQFGALIAQTEQDIVKLKQSARALREAKHAQAEAQEVRTVTSFLRNVIRDAGPHITRHLIQQISAEANTLFSEIMGDASAELSLTEDYDVQLEQHGHRRAFAQLSGGEQMSAALAVRLGLLRQLSDINIAFFDEPTQNMDSERRRNLAEQLERVTGFHQLFVISHDDTFEPMVSTVLRVRKENGVSTVEQV